MLRLHEIARAIVTARIYELEAQDPAGAKDLPSFAGNFSICSERIRVGDRDTLENVIALWGHEEGARLRHVHEIIQAVQDQARRQSRDPARTSGVGIRRQRRCISRRPDLMPIGVSCNGVRRWICVAN